MRVEVRELRAGARPSVTAVLPHFGDPAETGEAVAAMRAAGYPDLHIVVVDNSGNLGELPHADVEVIRPGGNVGYCAAMNLGVRHARERGHALVLFVNNDTLVGRGNLEGMVDALLADDTVAGVGPLLTTDGGRRIWSAGSFLRFGPNEVVQRGLGRPVAEAPRFPTEVHFLPGALALYRVADLAAVGDIQEAYFMYLEDVDLGARLRQRQRRLLYLPWLEAHHGGSISSGGGVTPLRKFLNGVNTPRLLRECRSIKLWISFVLFDILGLVPSILLHVHRPRRLRAQLAKGRGILLGLFGYRPGPRDVEHYCRER